MSRFPPLLLVLASVLGTSVAQAEPTGSDCSSPRAAAETWLGNLQDESWNPKVAMACFDFAGTGLAPEVQKERVLKLKQVLDARGLWVEMDKLPLDARAGGQESIAVFPERLPELVLTRDGRRWVFGPDVVRAVPDLFAATFSVNMDNLVEKLPSWMRTGTYFQVAWWQVIALMLVILLGLVVRAVTAWILATQGRRVLRRMGDSADPTILVKAAKPIGTLVMAAFLWYALPLLQFSARTSQVAHIAVRVLAALAGVMLLYRIVDLLSDIFARRAEQTETKLDDQLVPLVRKSLKVFVVALGVIFVLQNMDVDVGSLLAGASLGGLAFTLAARDTVANFFGSISIFADRPFQVGDWVSISGAEGIVEEVGMRSTRIRTFYNSLITVPNHIIANATVDNYGAREYRRCFTTLGLTYDTSPEQLQAFCDGVRAILTANEFVRKDYYEVHFSGFGAHSLDIMVYFFFKVDSWSEELRQRHNIYLEIIRLADTLGVSFAFPTQSIHVETMAQAISRPAPKAPDDEVLKAAILSFSPGGDKARPKGPALSHGFFASAGRAGGDDGDGG